MQSHFLLLTISLALICSVSISAAAEPYRLPPQDLVDLIDAPPSPEVDISPDGEWMLMIERDALPGIDDVSRRIVRPDQPATPCQPLLGRRTPFPDRLKGSSADWHY